jgi:hypothetical protein
MMNANNQDSGDEDPGNTNAFLNPLLIIALSITSLIAIWGLVDTAGLADIAARLVAI